MTGVPIIVMSFFTAAMEPPWDNASTLLALEASFPPPRPRGVLQRNKQSIGLTEASVLLP